MQWRLTTFIILLGLTSYAQEVKTIRMEKEKRWVLNSSLNLPAAKFHIAENPNGIDGLKPDQEVKGYLELFSSFGIGLSMNFGETSFFRDLDTNEILDDETEFTNLMGFQLGVLYSSKVDDQELISINEFSLYGGLNILDVQVGAGYELGVQRKNASRWFVSVAYGIPIYKLTGRGSYIFKKKSKDKELVPSMGVKII